MRRPTISRKALFGGVGAALGAGLLLGLIARPQIGVMERRPMPAVTAAAAPLPVEVRPPAPVKAAPGKLEVLPPDMAAAARPPPRLDIPRQTDEAEPVPPPESRHEWRPPPRELAPPDEPEPDELQPPLVDPER